MAWQYIELHRFRREETIDLLLSAFHGGDPSGFEVFVAGNFDDATIGLYLSDAAAEQLEAETCLPSITVDYLPRTCRRFIGRGAAMRGRLQVVR